MARKGLEVGLFIVDPQNDFMGQADGTPYQEGAHVATLPVKGAVEDMARAATLIDRIGGKLSKVFVTLDSHRTLHIAHADLWVDGNGRPPAPFTLIRADDMKNGMWRARDLAHQKRMQQYLTDLEASGNVHIIWPPHCLIGTWGHAVERTLMDALLRWERKELATVDYITKGSAVWSEHFGGLEAQVPDPRDSSTQVNMEVVSMLKELDQIAVLGEASSHCVRETVLQTVKYLGAGGAKKMVLLTDCMSPVPQAPGGPDFPAIADAFLKDMQTQGMSLMKAAEFLA
jgi:nicotinamidase/pyrazinamidase